MHKLALFRLHLIVFLWGFTAILGKLIHANAQILVFYRMLFAAIFLFVFIRIYKKSIKVSKKYFFSWLQLVLWRFTGIVFYSIKVSNVSIALSCLSLSTLFASILEPIIFKRKIDISEVVMGVVIVACILLIFKTEFQYKEGIIYGIFVLFWDYIFGF
jgi:drug/metabolite transporter (DMT)-like permease